jgi:hypothetical protein
MNKVIVAGSRDLEVDVYFIEACIARLVLDLKWKSKVVEIVSGGAKGMDASGERYANAFELDCIKFPANWDLYKAGAGPIRNMQMADYADALLLIWDGSSKGSANMKTTMQKLNKPVFEVIIQFKGLV